MMKHPYLRLMAFAAPLVFAGCTVGPDYHRPKTDVPVEWHVPTVHELEKQEHQEHGRSRTVAQPIRITRWWTTFDDPQLDELIDQAAKANLDLRQAQARVLEARARWSVTSSRLYPQATLNGSYQHERISQNGIASAFGGAGASSGSTPALKGALLKRFNLWQAGFDASWELDIFGGTRRAIEAAKADIGAAVDDRRDVLVSLLGEVARNYIDLRGLQRRLAIANENLKAQKQTLDLTQRRFKNGLSPSIDVSRAQAQVANTAAQIPVLETSIRQTMHRLAVLLAKPPASLVKELSDPRPVPPVPSLVPVGLPSDLLRRRPDIRGAERRFAAATARIGVATADLFPKFSLTGSGGLQSVDLENLLDWDSRFYGLGPSISWPIFQFGRVKARIHVQDALQKQALLAYKQTVLGALREVDDALVAYAKEQDRQAALAQAVKADEHTVALAQQLYKQGLTGFLDVLDAQRSVFAAQDALARSRTAVSTDLVALYKALGGGWRIKRAANTTGDDQANHAQNAPRIMKAANMK